MFDPIGGSNGWGLFLRTSDPTRDTPIYDDAFSDEDIRGGFPSSYVGWPSGGAKGPRPTREFAPVPLSMPGSQIRVFELPSRTYSRDAIPPGDRTPLLMNIFVPKLDISDADFNFLADCLGRYQAEINRALIRVGSIFLGRPPEFYHPLRLGAVVHGLPPWYDQAYVDQIRSLYRDKEPEKDLPEGGMFTLYKGQTASGVIDGKQVRVSILPTGKVQWEIDGRTLPAVPKQVDIQNAGLRDVVWYVDGLRIGQNICRIEDMGKCAKTIEPWFSNSDGSTQFWMTLRVCKNVWASDPAQMPYLPRRCQ